MGWEDRGGRSYYYRKRRRGNRVVSEYAGTGDVATLAALFDGEDREAAEAAREARRREQEEDRSLDRRLDALVGAAKAEAGAYLRSLGYHQHKRTWRRRRGQHSTD